MDISHDRLFLGPGLPELGDLAATDVRQWKGPWTGAGDAPDCFRGHPTAFRAGGLPPRSVGWVVVFLAAGVTIAMLVTEQSDYESEAGVGSRGPHPPGRFPPCLTQRMASQDDSDQNEQQPPEKPDKPASRSRWPPSATAKKRLQKCFETASQKMAQENYDYATELFRQCVWGDPGNKAFVQNFLGNLQKKYANNRKGSSLRPVQGTRRPQRHRRRPWPKANGKRSSRTPWRS